MVQQACPAGGQFGLSVLATSLLLILSAAVSQTAAGDPARGYLLLTEKAYLPADFDQQTFDELWQVWPDPIRGQAEKSTPSERRSMAFRRYGLTPRPNDPAGRPLQYVVTPDGQWVMNCFACHGGEVNGQTWPGAPNRDYALEMLTDDIRRTKLRIGRRLTHMDIGSLMMPLGTNRGTTNAVNFGVALLAFRDDQLNVVPHRFPPSMKHHDMDAPPWWHFRRKRHLYIDGFAPKAHRPLMQFMLVEQNGPEDFRNWETDFKHVFAYISSLAPPAYPDAIDARLAENGRRVFSQHCARCHGRYNGTDDEYPERRVAWTDVRTDRARLDALTSEHRRRYATSWFAEGHTNHVTLEPDGYVAPPLDGVWASAPYLHNGSLPTLWHLLHPDQRPVVWRRTSHQQDAQRVGLAVEEYAELPAEARNRERRREYFDTRVYGKSATGHDFAAVLTEPQRVALLEYLKAL